MDLKDQTLTQIHMDLAIGSENTTTWRMDIGILNKKLKKTHTKLFFDESGEVFSPIFCHACKVVLRGKL